MEIPKCSQSVCPIAQCAVCAIKASAAVRILGAPRGRLNRMIRILQRYTKSVWYNDGCLRLKWQHRLQSRLVLVVSCRVILMPVLAMVDVASNGVSHRHGAPRAHKSEQSLPIRIWKFSNVSIPLKENHKCPIFLQVLCSGLSGRSSHSGQWTQNIPVYPSGNLAMQNHHDLLIYRWIIQKRWIFRCKVGICRCTNCQWWSLMFVLYGWKLSPTINQLLKPRETISTGRTKHQNLQWFQQSVVVWVHLRFR